MMKRTFFRMYRILSEIKHQFIMANTGSTIYCKHQPSCGKYWQQQVEKDGWIKGSWKGIRRVISCY